MRGEELQDKYGATKRTRSEKTYNCMKCGQVRAESAFYDIPNTNLWNVSKNKVLFCKNCIQGMFESYKEKYGIKISTIICCSILDIPYSEYLFNQVFSKEGNTLGNYVLRVKSGTYRSQSFADSIISSELITPSDHNKIEVSEESADNKNRKFVISIIGYDPFADSTFSELEKRRAYNMMSSYCELPNVEDNPHTIQTIIQIVEQQMQIEILNNRINHLLISGHGSDDDKLLQTYISSRKNIQDSIVKMAESSNIAASKNSGSNTNKNTLAVKMKEMLDDMVEEAQPNLFDIKWCDAARQIADISNKSILEQLDLQENDYADMVKKQREIITKQEERLDFLEEENRNLKNQLLRMEE